MAKKRQRNGYEIDDFCIASEIELDWDETSSDETYSESSESSWTDTTGDGSRSESPYDRISDQTDSESSADKVIARPKRPVKATKPLKARTFIHEVTTSTPIKQRIAGKFLQVEGELCRARDERNSSAEKLSTLQLRVAELEKNNKSLRALLKETRAVPLRNEPIRHVTGTGVLLNLRHVKIDSLDPGLLTLIKGLYTSGVLGSQQQVSRMLNCSKGTVIRILSHLGPSVIGAVPRRLKPASLHARHIDQVALDCWAKLPTPTTVQLQEAMHQVTGLHLTLRYVRKVCSRIGLLWRKPRMSQMITEEDKAKRLLFAKTLLEGPEELLLRLIFSDEKYFVVRYGAQAGWIQPGQPPPKHYRVQSPPKVMIWLGIGPMGERQCTDAFWYAPSSRQDAALYIATPKACMQPACAGVVPQPVLMQDNAPTHTAKATKSYLASQTAFSVLNSWPPRSPDLNPIENLWAWLAMKLVRQTVRPRNAEEIKASVSAILRTNECQDIIRRLHASFRGRLEKCVAAQGGHTNY